MSDVTDTHLGTWFEHGGPTRQGEYHYLYFVKRCARYAYGRALPF